MTTTTGSYVEDAVEVAGARLHYLKGGSGRPVVVLHGVEGPEGWLAFHEALARNATVYAPTQAGYGESQRPEWAESIQHQALIDGWLLQELGLGPVDLVGFGVGGWTAAEIAVMAPQSVRRLVLVDAAGIRPRDGAIRDIFTMPWRDVVEQSFFDSSASSEYQRIYGANPVVDFGGAREAGRVMSMRTCYKPYMHDPALLPMLGRLRMPTIVLWGDTDRIVPLECGRMYAEAIPGATLRVIERCGHWPHYEHPEATADIVRQFLAG